ncbi:MAG: ABC transporter permease [Fibromonadaceae bacterium]|jgi:peptide/nickel transport system permease protein|nr:ABC transporter permease [Fibromonadaceae bacterium]
MFKKYPTVRYVLQRAIWYFLTFLVALSLNFFLPRLGSDPVDIMMAQSSFSSPEIRKQTEENLRKEFGLLVLDKQDSIVRDTVRSIVIDTVVNVVADTVIDEQGNVTLDSLGNVVVSERNETVINKHEKIEINAVKASKFSQLINYIGQVFQGDLGTSFKNQKKVSEIIAQALPWTIALQLPAILFGWIFGNGLGALAAYRRGVFDKVIFPLALLMSSIPFFVFGMVLVYFFGVVWDIFPAVGAYSLELTPGFSLDFILSIGYHYILPFFSIFLILAGGQAIGMRSMGIYELGTDYIKYAKWLGLKESRVLVYLFRNAMLPQLTGLALSIGQMVGGALITEMIFSYPGLGMAMLTAIQTNDYPVIQGVTLLITTSVLLANFTVDILIALLDPRVKQSLSMDAK